MHDHHSHHRRSIRLKGYDYSQPGVYFVTLVTWGRECLFGEIQSGEMRLSSFGRLAEIEWRRLAIRYERIIEDEFIVMPNHIHGIIWIVEKDEDENVGARQNHIEMTGNVPLASPLPGLRPPLAASLGAIVGAYKSTTARLINGMRRSPGTPVWQRNYHEHIIRNEREWGAIRAYISNNPLNWEQDHEHP
jgi:putative transposase